MDTNDKRCSAIWAVVLAGAIWGAAGVGIGTRLCAEASGSYHRGQPVGPRNREHRRAARRFRPFPGRAPGDRERCGRQSGGDERSKVPARASGAASFPREPPAGESRPARLPQSGSMEVPVSPVGHLGVYGRPCSCLRLFVCALLAVLWVLRTLLENRRWNRSFKMHEDVHTKLIEKFASGQDFSAYMQSDAGRRLLEWTPPTSGHALRAACPIPSAESSGRCKPGWSCSW